MHQYERDRERDRENIAEICLRLITSNLHYAAYFTTFSSISVYPGIWAGNRPGRIVYAGTSRLMHLYQWSKKRLTGGYGECRIRQGMIRAEAEGTRNPSGRGGVR